MNEHKKLKKFKWLKTNILTEKHIQEQIDKSISLYTQYLNDRGISPHSIKEYIRIAKGLLLLSQKPPEHLTPEDIENYIETHYTQRSDNKIYITKTLSLLRKYLKFTDHQLLAHSIVYPSETSFKTLKDNYKLNEEMTIYLNSIWNDYLLRLKAFGRTDRTATSYRSALISFLSITNKTIPETTEEDIISWITSMKERASDSTINLYRRILITIFKYFDKDSIFKNIPPITQYKPPTKQIAFKKIENLLKQAQTDINYPWSYPFLILMAFSGARITALCQIQAENIDLNNNIITIQKAKGNKGRLIPLNEKFVKPVLTQYINEHKIKYGPLFYNSKGNPLQPHNVRNYLHNHSKDLGYLSPHDFRRAISQELMRKSNYNIYFVSKFLGHSDVKVTERYVGDLFDEMQEMYNQYTNSINISI